MPMADPIAAWETQLRTHREWLEAAWSKARAAGVADPVVFLVDPAGSYGWRIAGRCFSPEERAAAGQGPLLFALPRAQARALLGAVTPCGAGALEGLGPRRFGVVLALGDSCEVGPLAVPD